MRRSLQFTFASVATIVRRHSDSATREGAQQRLLCSHRVDAATFVALLAVTDPAVSQADSGVPRDPHGPS